ncbi:MAG: hypothetical protein PVH88_11115 [Ignavibacteria bacterium]|jgi:hypothetical protein
MNYRKSSFFIVVFVLLPVVVLPQSKIEINKLHSSYTTKENRILFKEKLLDRINSTLSKNLNSLDEYLYRKAIEDAGMYLVKNDTVKNAVNFGLINYEKYSSAFTRSLLETVYTLYPKEYSTEVDSIFKATFNEQIFIICLKYLLKNSVYNSEEIQFILKGKFPNRENNAVLKYFYEELNNNFKLPPLLDLLKHKFQDNKTIVYSFHRKDRSYLGITIIKSPDGKFVRNNDGKFFHVTHLARSASNLPGYLKNGNTPQGIFSIVGYYITPTESIGPTPILLTRCPFEKPTEIFYHGNQNSSKWNIEDYKSLLPQSWHNYFPITEAYYAGKAGRRLIIAHGTADDISFYENEIYYPFTPTKGCLSTKEIWNDDGKLVESGQVELMNAFFSTNQLKGFLVVVEIDDQKKTVTLDELLPAILEAEK